MMPQEKAKELVEGFKPCFPSMFAAVAKQCALISVDEIINNYSAEIFDGNFILCDTDWWQKVKQEIEKL